MFSGEDTVMVLFFSVEVIGDGSVGFEGSDVALFCVKFVTLCLCYLGYSCGVGFKFTRPVGMKDCVEEEGD